MKRFGFLLAASALTATPLAAQGMDQGSANMTGPRIEVRAGLDRPELNVTYDDGVNTIDQSDGTSGVAYGGEIGYDVAMGPTVIGAYAGIDFASTEFCSEVYGQDEACLSAGRNITVGIRAGSQVARNALLYIKGGYSNGRATLSYTDSVDPSYNFKMSDNLDGFHLGAGAEISLGRHAYGKLEYIYSEYKGYNYSDADVSAGISLRRHQVLAGLGLRF